MKKLTLIALSLLLALSTLCGLAEDANLETVSFGDFSMTINTATTAGSIDEKQNNAVFFQLYPDYDEDAAFHCNYNAVWSNQVMDVTAQDPTQYASMVLDAIVEQYESLGLQPQDAALIAADHDEQDGKPALVFLYQVSVDYTALGRAERMTLYTVQAVFSDAAFEGSYTFTATADSLDALDPLMEILNTITWAK